MIRVGVKDKVINMLQLLNDFTISHPNPENLLSGQAKILGRIFKFDFLGVKTNNFLTNYPLGHDLRAYCPF